MRKRYRRLRLYAASITAATSYLVTGLMLWSFTNLPIGGVFFVPIIAFYLSFLAVASITDPKRIPKKRQRIDWDMYALYEVEADGRLGRQII